MTKREIAKQIKENIVEIYSYGLETISNSEMEKFDIEELKVALTYIQEAKRILKTK